MNIRILGVIIFVFLLLTACSTTKFVPEGEFLLDKVHIKTDNKDIPQNELKARVEQLSRKKS